MQSSVSSSSVVSPRKRRALNENAAPNFVAASSSSPIKRRPLQQLNPPVLSFQRNLQPANKTDSQIVRQSTSNYDVPRILVSRNGLLSTSSLVNSATTARPTSQIIVWKSTSKNDVTKIHLVPSNSQSVSQQHSTPNFVNSVTTATSTSQVVKQSKLKNDVAKILVSRNIPSVVQQRSTCNPVNSVTIKEPAILKNTNASTVISVNSNLNALEEQSSQGICIPRPNKHYSVVRNCTGDYVSLPPLPHHPSTAIAQVLPHLTDISCRVITNQRETNIKFPSVVQHSSPAILDFHKRAEEISKVVDTLPSSNFRPSSSSRKSLSLKKKTTTTITPSAADQQGDALLHNKEISLDNVISNTAEQAEAFFKEKSVDEILRDSLPVNYDHHIVSVEPYQKQPNDLFDQSSMFTAEVRVNLKSKSEALQWLEDYKTSSYTDWNVRRTYPVDTKCIIFKKGYRCNHNTLAQYRKIKTEPHEKHTECDAYISITVKNFQMKRSKDKLLKQFPCVIIIHHCHNHPIVACDALRHRKPSTSVKEIFRDMFRKGHSPSSALHTHQYDLQLANPTTYFEDLADGAKCPNVQWCYYQYKKMFQQEYGDPNGLAMLESLRSFVDKYNTDCGSVCAKVETFENSDIVVVLCSPLMKRVHEYLKSSGEMVFLDSGGMMDRQNSRVFTFLSPSVAGALPTGMIITSSESEEVLTFGMKLLLTILPSCAFYGRGAQGPVVAMTDDSCAERNSLRNTFPGIILLLCLFHILSAFWRYVWDSKHQVDPKDKEEIFFLFKNWCMAERKEDFMKLYEELVADPRISANKFLKTHIEDLCKRSSEWALCFRKDIMIRGNNTDNYSEAAIRRFKEDILNRVRAYSLTQLFDFFTTRLEAYFERRIAAVLNNRQENYWRSKHYIKPSKLEHLLCLQTPRQNMFVVRNCEKKTEYIVDTELELCTCFVGKNGAPCKHQCAVVLQFNLTSTQFLPFGDAEAKHVLHKIMSTTGPRSGWYAPLKSGPGTSNYEEVNEGNIDYNSTPQCVDATNDVAASSSAEPDLEAQAQALDALDAIYDCIKKGLIDKPDVYTPAVQKFSELFNKAKGLSENALLSSMHMFGRESLGMRTLHGRYIKVNTAATIRRKYAAMSGRKCTNQGRPGKASRSKEHGYCHVSKVKKAAWERVPPKSTALPHNLSQRIRHTSQQIFKLSKKKK